MLLINKQYLLILQILCVEWYTRVTLKGGAPPPPTAHRSPLTAHRSPPTLLFHSNFLLQHQAPDSH